MSRSLAAALACLLGAVLGFGLGFIVANDKGAEEAAAVQRPPATALAEIADNPRDFYGDQVWIGGEVNEVLGPRSFVLGGPPLVGGDRVLVVTRQPVARRGGSLPTPVLENDFVHLVGEVRRLNVAELEKEIGHDLTRELDLFPADDLRERGGPVVVARTVAVSPRAFPILDTRSTEQLMQDAPRLVGEVAATTGRVTDLRDNRALVLDGRLLVLVPRGNADLPSPGSTVAVVGAVRTLDPDQVRGPRFPDFDRGLLSEFLNRPIMIAESVQVSHREPGG